MEEINVTSLAEELKQEIELDQPVPKKPKKKNQPMLLVERKIDSKTIKRTRIPLTPAICQECAWNACEAFELPPWDMLKPVHQEKVKKLMLAHRRKVHPPEMDKIVDATDLPGEWLGTRR